MNLSDLKAELDLHFPGQTRAAVIAADPYWDERVVLQGDITVAQALAWATSTGVLPVLRSIRQTTTNPLYPVADAACTMFEAGYPVFSLTDPTVMGLIDVLVTANLVTTVQKASLLAIGQTTVKRIWNDYQVGTITPEAIQLALNS